MRKEDNGGGMVRDLINRSDVIQILDENGWLYETNIEDLIKEISTSYDVDKVVEELEKSSKWVNETNEYCDDDGNDYIPLSKAIEIVKAGGENDNLRR